MKAPPHQHNHAAAPDLAARLREHARKITGPRRAVLDYLRRQAHPVTAREAYAALAGR
jgi:Fe2+ or Zn2+ uptake regulation protein